MKHYIQATYIKTARSELGLTQPALAEKLGVGARTIMSWEQGWRNPNKNGPAMKMLEIILAEHEKRPFSA